MMKKMIEAEKKDRQAPQPALEIKNDVYTSNTIANFLIDFVIADRQNHFTMSSAKSSSGFLQSIFHPPAV